VNAHFAHRFGNGLLAPQRGDRFGAKLRDTRGGQQLAEIQNSHLILIRSVERHQSLLQFPPILKSVDR
jgi:hypothetical protein